MIVIIAKEDDNHAVAVKKVLESVYNENVFVFDTSKFPTIYRLNGNFSNGAISFSLEKFWIALINRGLHWVTLNNLISSRDSIKEINPIDSDSDKDFKII